MKHIYSIFIFSLGALVTYSLLSFFDFGDDWKIFINWEIKDQYLNFDGLILIGFHLVILNGVAMYFLFRGFAAFTKNRKDYEQIAPKGECLELPDDVNMALSRIERHINYGLVRRYGLIRPSNSFDAEDVRKDIALIRAALAARQEIGEDN